ncbi:hypothetical protein SSX86_019692 [Deinandra increscens subsp. villosa]|uniref:C2H2-type domain-containing protein n=1 Tax=Deinandra increscens subsp. villosa TaxID=3103831 RepID=A0AAP0GXH3_9ASTR
MDFQDQTKPTTPSGNESLEVHICHRCRFPFPNPHPSSQVRRAHNRICGSIKGYANLIVDSEADSDDEEEEEVKTPRYESHEVHICIRCGWPFPNSHPSSKHRRAHKKVCGTIEGHSKFDSEADSDDEAHSDSYHEVEEKTPSPKIEKRIIKESGSSTGGIEEKSNRSEDDMFSDAVTEFSDTKISPGVTSEAKKVDVNYEIFESPIGHSKDTDEIEENDTKRSTPLVENTDGSHKDKVIDQMSEVSGDKDQGEDVHEQRLSLSEPEPFLDKRKDSIKFDQKIAESVVSDSKDSVKVGTSQTLVDEGRGKLLTGQYYGADTSGCSSSNSLEGNWGSVSEIQNAFSKSEISDDRTRLGRSDAFEGLSLVESEEEEIVEQKASEIKVNEEAIAKVTNWSTSEAKSSNPKQLANLVKKDEDAEKASQLEKSNLTHDTPEVNQESSSLTHGSEGKKVEKKTKEIPSWVRFLCCSTSIRR